jgi:choice-of-anchor C domain-containing protein
MSSLQKTVLAAALALASVAAQAAPVNLILNGNFEMDDPDVASGGFTKVSAGQTMINHWTVGGNSVDLIQTNYGSIDNVSIDLAGSPGPGSISQSFTVQAGTTYELVFDYFRNLPGTALSVNFGSLGTASFSVASSIVRNQTLRWTAASNGTGSVTFASGSGVGGPTIDNVRVFAVPAPQTIGLTGLALVMLAAVARRRPAA